MNEKRSARARNKRQHRRAKALGERARKLAALAERAAAEQRQAEKQRREEEARQAREAARQHDTEYQAYLARRAKTAEQMAALVQRTHERLAAQDRYTARLAERQEFDEIRMVRVGSNAGDALRDLLR